MATLDIEIQDWKAARFGFDTPQTYITVIDNEVLARSGVLRSIGILTTRTANSGSLEDWRCDEGPVSGISGYRRMKLGAAEFGDLQTRTTTFTGSPIPLGEQTIEKYASNAGDMTGFISRGSTATAHVRARKVVGSGETCKVRFELRHRTAGGTETVIGSFTTGNLTSGFVNYSDTFTVSRSWDTNERLVVHLIGINEGAPP